LTLEAGDHGRLPPYLGSTLRGALGHLLRAALCEGSGCGHHCQRPNTCRYYSLFEREYEGAKPFLLLSPSPPGLEEIAMGGAVTLPYRTTAPKNGETIPSLRCETEWTIEPGWTVQFGLRLVGVASNALPSIVEAVSRCGLSLAGTPFRIGSARDGLGNVLYDRRFPGVPVQMPAMQRLALETEMARRVRIVFLTPSVLKVGKSPTFAPQEFVARFFEQCIGRAGKMQQTCAGVRPPWVEAPATRAELVGHRLFHYDLLRHSFRQDKWLEFDGVVGYIELKGEFSAGIPWARAAEVLHFGQKSAFGLGKVRFLILD